MEMKTYRLAVSVTPSLASRARAKADVCKAFAAAATAASPAKISSVTVERNPNASPVSLLTSSGKRVVFGTSAVCRHLYGAPSGLALDVDEWVEWDARTGSPAAQIEKRAASTTTPFLAGTLLTLADVVVGTSLHLQGGSDRSRQLMLAADALKSGIDQGLASWEKAAAALPKIRAAPKIDLSNGNIKAAMQSIFDSALAAAFPAAFAKGIGADVKRASRKGDAEYQANCAMRVFAAVKGLPDAPKNPREVALRIVDAVKAIKLDAPFIARMDVAGPGFINISVDEKLINDRMARIVVSKASPKPKAKRKRVAVDFSSPNIAKEMHVGHLRSTIIGDTICRLLTFIGHDVKRINHVGDWGTQFGMLLTHMKDNHPDFLVNPPPISDLNAFYKESKKRFDDDADFKKRSQDEVVRLQGGDESSLTGWRSFCKVSERMFTQVYARLGVSFPDGTCGESFYNSRIPAVIDELLEKKVAVESEGALVCFVDGYKIPLMVRKSNGGYGYGSTDVTAFKYRLQELKSEWNIYVIDNGQSLHLDLLFKVAEKAGWANEFCKSSEFRVDHVKFGVVQGKDKKRFKTRSGETVRLVDLLDEAKARMVTELEKRLKEGRTPLTADQIDDVAGKVGYAAVKYADLKNNREKDYVFDYDKMLDPNGDTAVYLLYSYARSCSVLRKVEEATGTTIDALLESGEWKQKLERAQQEEWELCNLLLTFPDVVEQTADTLLPHVLCEFVYKLSVAFSAFYNSCRLIDQGKLDPVRGKTRVAIVRAYLVVMDDAMRLLGMEPVPSM